MNDQFLLRSVQFVLHIKVNMLTNLQVAFVGFIMKVL